MNHSQVQKGNQEQSHRFIELDILRGVAILFMIILHLFWDLYYFGILPLNKNLYSLNIIVPVIFFLLVGICLAVNNNKHHNQSRRMYPRMIQRGLWIFNLGMLFTFLTSIFLPDKPILFGVLHCIGCCIILSTLLLKLKSTNIILAVLVIVSGLALGFFYTIELITDERPAGRGENAGALRAGVIGQDHACDVVARALARFKTGLDDPERPVASLLFVGPTGVGKTELAKQIATYLFGHGERLVRVDLSEYMTPGSAQRLLEVAAGPRRWPSRSGASRCAWSCSTSS